MDQPGGAWGLSVSACALHNPGEDIDETRRHLGKMVGIPSL